MKAACASVLDRVRVEELFILVAIHRTVPLALDDQRGHDNVVQDGSTLRVDDIDPCGRRAS